MVEVCADARGTLEVHEVLMLSFDHDPVFLEGGVELFEHALDNAVAWAVATDHPELVAGGIGLRRYSMEARQPQARTVLGRQRLELHATRVHGAGEDPYVIHMEFDLLPTVDLSFERWVARGGVRIVPLPLKVPAVEVHQFWHSRLQKDPAHAWIRAKVHVLFADHETPRRVVSSRA